MKSKITIDVDYFNNPVLEVKVANYHPLDLRDKMLQRFFDQLRKESFAYGESRWFKFNDDVGSGGENGNDNVTFADYTLYPVKPSEILDEAAAMIQRANGQKMLKEGVMDYYEIITAAVMSKLKLGELNDNTSVKDGLNYLITKEIDRINEEKGGIFTADDIRSRVYSIIEDYKLMKDLKVAAIYAASGKVQD